MEDLDKAGRTPKRRTLDLSLAQVAASALAAVVGAVLASQLGVYGTILGAAVVSVGATTGGAVFQHLFRRTGEQLREMSSGAALVGTSPDGREPVAPGPDAGSDTGPDAGRHAGGAGGREGGRTAVFDPFDPGGERTRMMARINPPEPAEAVAVYRGRNTWKPKSWKVYAVTATLVFALAMGTVGVMELVVGKPAGQWGGGGGGKPAGQSVPVDPAGGGSGGGTGGGDQPAGGSEGKQRESATPSTAPSSTPQAGGGPSPTRSPDAGSSVEPTPPTSPSGSPGSGSGSGSGSGASGDAVDPKAAPSP